MSLFGRDKNDEPEEQQPEDDKFLMGDAQTVEEPLGNEDSNVLPQEGDSFVWPVQEQAAEPDPEPKAETTYEPEPEPDRYDIDGSRGLGEVATPQAEAESVGLYGKFTVERNDGKDRPGGPKEDARYFVLDYVNDPVARVALRAYITELTKRRIEPELVEDLNRELNETYRLARSKP